MPAVAERLREGVRGARDFIASRLSRLDPRAAVQGDALKRVNVREKLEGLLNGQPRRQFNLEDPFYSGSVWGNHPTQIEVIRRPDGFDLFVQTRKYGDPPDNYGWEMDIRGGKVEFFELLRMGGRTPFNLHPTVRPWDEAQRRVDRVVMATSNDPDVRGRYKAMREKEDRSQQQLVA